MLWAILAVLCGLGALGAAIWADRQMRLAQEAAARIDERHRLILRENDIAVVVNSLLDVVKQHQQVLQKLHAAQEATHGAVMHLLRHAEASADPERGRGVVFVTLFGSPYRGDA